MAWRGCILFGFGTASLLALAAGWTTAFAQRSLRLEQQPDSVTQTLEFDNTLTGRAEYDGQSVKTFRLYTGERRSLLVWQLKDDRFQYAVEGPAHDQRAMHLMEGLTRWGLKSFVAERHGSRRDFIRVRRVFGLQLETQRTR